MLKIVSLFLIGMAVLAMFGRLRWPGSKNRLDRDKSEGALPKPKTCPKCGRMNLRGGPCRACREGTDG
ncbi:hypothetical protein V8J82_06025 [Gymnodinialimonas sp. 2305UL16-5]|uniref:hypothetical protein n=1 Tax=Gymnodinialimonas mytili TaxID=3126503 RepID=UPI0030A2B27F